ncbi:MAG: YibE/F family protein [Eubacteriales bacterium]|nr:YibE/F family protein [Eubacteriales bacterium]
MRQTKSDKKTENYQMKQPVTTKHRRIGKKAGSLAFLALAAILFCALLYYANYDRPTYTSSDTSGIEYEVGKVTGILADNKVADESVEGQWLGTMDLQIEILTGRYKGQSVNVTNYFSALYNVRVEQGDKVSIRIDTSEDGYQVSIYNYYRVPQMIGCVLVFLLLLIIIGGKKGAKSAAGLIFTMVCILWLLLPLALKGYPPLWVTIFLILICNLLTFYLVDGIQAKTIVAAAGSVCGVLAGAGFAMLAQAVMSVTTYQMDEAETLLLITTTTRLEVKDLFLCGILIACMGAVMDVAMSIASAVAEIHSVNPQMGRKELFRSGMNIGRDAMGTMSNTLILAFAGNSLNMILMIYSYGVGFQQLMNTDFVAIEVIRSIAGSIGIICTVPIVAFISAAYFGKNTD